MKASLTSFAAITVLAFVSSLASAGQVSAESVALLGRAVQGHGWHRAYGAEGISVSLPPTWQAKPMSSKQISSMLDTAHSKDSKMSNSSEANSVAQSSLKLMAFGPRNTKLQFTPNLNILKLGPAQATLDEAAAGNAEGMASVGAKKLTSKRVTFAAGPAQETQFRLPLKNGTNLRDLVFVLVKGSYIYQLTFSIPESDFNSVKPQLETIAASFRVK